MNIELFAKRAYEVASEHLKNALISRGFADVAETGEPEFYGLGNDKQAAWIHGCAVALNEFKFKIEGGAA
jgi:hypothetical protein